MEIVVGFLVFAIFITNMWWAAENNSLERRVKRMDEDLDEAKARYWEIRSALIELGLKPIDPPRNKQTEWVKR